MTEVIWTNRLAFHTHTHTHAHTHKHVVSPASALCPTTGKFLLWLLSVPVALYRQHGICALLPSLQGLVTTLQDSLLHCHQSHCRSRCASARHCASSPARLRAPALPNRVPLRCKVRQTAHCASSPARQGEGERERESNIDGHRILCSVLRLSSLLASYSSPLYGCAC